MKYRKVGSLSEETMFAYGQEWLTRFVIVDTANAGIKQHEYNVSRVEKRKMELQCSSGYTAGRWRAME